MITILITAGVALAIITMAFILFPSVRGLFKAFVGLFVEDMTKTPKGAEAVYNQAIDEASNEYARANNTLQKVAGQLSTAKDELELYKKKLAECEKKCEAFASAQQWDKVELYSQEREDLVEEVNTRIELVNKLTPIFEEAKLINNHCEEKLAKLKRDKKKVVSELILNNQLKEMYDDMDELKANTINDKLLNAVKEGAKDAKEHAVGAKVVHENKTSTKLQRADAEAKKIAGNSYAEELKKKYQKVQIGQ